MIWNLKEHSDNTALRDEFGSSLTYGELYKISDIISSKIGRRCLVFCLCRNEIGSVVGYVSFFNGKIPAVMANSHLEDSTTADLLKRC